MRMILMSLVALMLAAEGAAAQIPPWWDFFNRRGVILYEPQVDTVFSGARMQVHPTVSADRKYVTIGIATEISNLVELTTFPIFPGANGPVGGAVPAPLPGAQQGGLNIQGQFGSPGRPAGGGQINIGQGARGGAVLQQPGMTRISPP